MSDESKGAWEGAGGTVGVIIVLSLILFLLYKFKDSIPTGVFEIPKTFVAFVANMMPFALLAYGIAGDTVNQEFRLSIPSIASLISILLVGIGTQWFATSNGADLSPQDTTGRMWCTIPGLEGLESPYLPTAFMSTAIIAMYYLSWAWYTPRPWTFSLLAFTIVWFSQFAAFVAGDCNSSYVPIIGNSVAFNVILATLLGLAIGGITFASTFWNSQYNPYNLPAGSASAASGGGDGGGGGGCPAGYTPIGSNMCKSSSGGAPVCESGFTMNRGSCEKYLKTGGHSYPVQDGGDENTFVAELYKNGQLVTDSISA